MQHMLCSVQAEALGEGSSCHQRALSLCVCRAFPPGCHKALKGDRSRRLCAIFTAVLPRESTLTGAFRRGATLPWRSAAGCWDSPVSWAWTQGVYGPKPGSSHTLLRLDFAKPISFTLEKNLPYLSLNQNLIASVSDLKKDLYVSRNLFMVFLPLFCTQIQPHLHSAAKQTASRMLLMLWVLEQLRSTALLGFSVIIHVVCTHLICLKPMHHASLIITLKLDVSFFKNSKEVCRWFSYLPLK